MQPACLSRFCGALTKDQVVFRRPLRARCSNRPSLHAPHPSHPPPPHVAYLVILDTHLFDALLVGAPTLLNWCIGGLSTALGQLYDGCERIAPVLYIIRGGFPPYKVRRRSIFFLFSLLRTRGEINVLMCGDPGTSKSQLLAFVHKVSQILLSVLSPKRMRMI